VDLAEQQLGLATTNLWIALFLAFATCVAIFGVYCGVSQRVHAVRAYVLISFPAMICVCAAGFVDMTVFFSHQRDIIFECGNLGIEGKTWTKPFFANGDWPSNVQGAILSPYQAAEKCHDAWDKNSTTQMTTLIFLRVLPSIFIFLIPYAYYMQLINPNHPHASRELVNSAIPLSEYPETAYSPLYHSAGALQPQPQQGGRLLSARRPPYQGRGGGSAGVFAIGTATPGLTPGPPSYREVGGGGFGYGNGHGMGPQSGNTEDGY